VVLGEFEEGEYVVSGKMTIYVYSYSDLQNRVVVHKLVKFGRLPGNTSLDLQISVDIRS